MRIILTHEQTDFDGIASLLGAHLLDEAATPVLPRRMNRNVKAFVTIYGADLPFIDPRDIGDQTIDTIYLVDTQSLASVKGMHEKTKIHVVDHHPTRSDLPHEWEVRIVSTGANVTVFVEEFIERDIRLNVIEATLLLIGIYEDTGALTYSRTTPRDIHAAAYLLEQGAKLSIVNDFINHPLSPQQQIIYDQLRSTAVNHTIHGHNILVAQGDARGMDEELSTIAHKLRDLVDPDAIIMLMNIRGGIQLIARSTNDDIDVAMIASHFGGGGHPRAAAALIKTEDRDEIYNKLIQILPDVVRPAITVSEMMSVTPQLILPDTPIQEIASLIQRYGYEGYPVVKDNQIKGLVTRRAVDRALSHKLNLTAVSLMEAGDISISPKASIEELQTVMTNTGWGQIPVVDPENRQIIGIVTRTDLLETLAPTSIQNEKRNLADKLERALPVERLSLLKEIAKIAQEQRVALYIVGGFVRDLIIGFPSLDFDLVVEGDAIDLAKSVGKRFGGRVTTHKQFGTAKWFLHSSDFHKKQKTYLREPIHIRKDTQPNSTFIKTGKEELPNTLDFITARREFYSHPSALPTVERGSIKLDLHRRDFTINTLALRLDGNHYGNLHDYWGGYNDIRQGRLRVLHSLSFVDDPTRMLRAVRYEQRYNFTIGKRTLQLLLEARTLMNRVSGDRIRHELDNILKEDRSVCMLDRLNDLKLLESIHPELKWDPWIKRKIKDLELPSSEWGIGKEVKGIPVKRILVYALWLIRLPLSQAEKVVSRLRLPRVTKEVILDACHLWAYRSKMLKSSPSEITEELDKVQVVSTFAFYLATDNLSLRSSLKAYFSDWKYIKPTITGVDLKLLNLPPGPLYRKILKGLKAALIDGQITTKDEELALLKKMVDDLK